LLLLLGAGRAQAQAAQEYLFSFTAMNLTWDDPNPTFVDPARGLAHPPPQNPVTGSIEFFETPSSNGGAPTRSIVAVNLDIAGHQYTADQVGSFNACCVSGGYDFGGVLNGVGLMILGTNDFSLSWYGGPLYLEYTVASPPGQGDLWTSGSGTASVVPIPEPSDCALMLAGLTLVAAGAWRRKRKHSLVSRATSGHFS
jgi:hypothetical protein